MSCLYIKAAFVLLTILINFIQRHSEYSSLFVSIVGLMCVRLPQDSSVSFLNADRLSWLV